MDHVALHGLVGAGLVVALLADGPWEDAAVLVGAVTMHLMATEAGDGAGILRAR